MYLVPTPQPVDGSAHPTMSLGVAAVPLSSPMVLYHAQSPSQQAYTNTDVKYPTPAVVHHVQPPGPEGNYQHQPQSINQMQYAQPLSEEEMKKQKRAEQMAKARHVAGETCIVCGKACTVAWAITAAACSMMCCVMKCAGGMGGGGGGGFMGGGGGFSISDPGVN
jgi:hypothetical protein